MDGVAFEHDRQLLEVDSDWTQERNRPSAQPRLQQLGEFDVAVPIAGAQLCGATTSQIGRTGRPSADSRPQGVPDQLQRIARPVIVQHIEEVFGVPFCKQNPQLGPPVAFRHDLILAVDNCSDQMVPWEMWLHLSPCQ